MLKFQGVLFLLASAIAGQAVFAGPGNSFPPPAPREFRGVWVATVNTIDWPSKPGLSTESKRMN